MKYGFEEIKVISNVRHFGAYQEFIWGDEVDKAVNVKSGKEVWRDTKLAKPGYAGGMLTTAGNLTVYTTQGGGFTVANASTGEVLYTLNLGIAAKAGPDHLHAQRQAVIVQALGGTPGFGRDEAVASSSATRSSRSPADVDVAGNRARARVRAHFFA